MSEPTLNIHGEAMEILAHEYMSMGIKLMDSTVDPDNCGIANDYLTYLGISAYMDLNEDAVRKLCTLSPTVNKLDEGSEGWLYGRAGYLYFLRRTLCSLQDHDAERETDDVLVDIVRVTIEETVQRILASPRPWKFQGKEYLGAAHGLVGIMCQMVLSMPSIAGEIEPMLRQFLTRQLPCGNFPLTSDSQTNDRVDFCGGSSGFVMALTSMQPFFPNLEQLIDDAIARATLFTRQNGLVMIEPCLSHGLAGTALAIRNEIHRDQFLTHMTTENLEARGWLEKCGKGNDFAGLFTGEAGRAWVWFKSYYREYSICLGFNDSPLPPSGAVGTA